MKDKKQNKKAEFDLLNGNLDDESEEDDDYVPDQKADKKVEQELIK